MVYDPELPEGFILPDYFEEISEPPTAIRILGGIGRYFMLPVALVIAAVFITLVLSVLILVTLTPNYLLIKALLSDEKRN